ncbi:MAG: undecaprenyl pyrophosphate phosphatase, partial [Pseudomonadota bacterium]
MNIFEAIVLSVVEGITEFLPVSSTGHMILTQKLLGIEETEAVKAFLVVVQAGAILAVITVFWPTLSGWLKAWLSLLWPRSAEHRASMIGDRSRSLFFAFSVFPFAILGYLNRDFVKSLFEVHVVAYALIVGGVFILLDEWLFYR